MDYSTFETVTRRLALEAGAAIMEVYGSDDVGLQAKADESPVTRADLAADKVISAGLRAAFPDMTWEDEIEWQGHRPAPADSLPLIGEIPGTGVFTGFGHHHIGLTAGPKTGRLLAQLITGQRPNTDLTAYAPTRFA